MYATAHRVRASRATEGRAAGDSGFNASLYLHGESPIPRRLDANRVAEVAPGEPVARIIQVPPGGNFVDSYLDVVAGDDVSAEALAKTLTELEARAPRARTDYGENDRIGEVLVRLYVSPRVPSTARAEVRRLAGHILQLRAQFLRGEGATLDLVRRRTADGFVFVVDPEASVPSDPDFTSPGKLEMTTQVLDELEAAHGSIFSVLPTTLLSPVQLEGFNRVRVVDESGEVLWESSGARSRSARSS